MEIRRRLVESIQELLVLQFFGHRSSPPAAPHVRDAHNIGFVIDGKEDVVHVRLPPVAQDADGVVWVDALRGDRTAPRMVVEREDGAFETVELLGALLWRALDDPEIQLLKFGFRVPCEVNAVCHACGAAD